MGIGGRGGYDYDPGPDYDYVPASRTLQPGDVIPFGSFQEVVESLQPDGMVRTRRYDRSSDGQWVLRNSSGTRNPAMIYDIFRPRMKADAEPAPVKPAKDSSRWPGTCPKCGKGTYTGANVFEHEGECK